jgi:hypothetical protein
MEERRLSAAGGADNAKELTPRDLEIDSLQGVEGLAPGTILAGDLSETDLCLLCNLTYRQFKRN